MPRVFLLEFLETLAADFAQILVILGLIFHSWFLPLQHLTIIIFFDFLPLFLEHQNQYILQIQNGAPCERITL
jgi:hypothetical protein